MFTVKEHWRYFSEFCRWELASGGPDPQIPLVGWMSRNCDWSERIWRGGCYIWVYNVPFAEAIWREWSWERVCKEPRRMLPWLKKNWPGIVTRFERRCVRRPEWMAEFLLGYAQWAGTLHTDLSLKAYDDLTPEERYLKLWDSCQTVPRLGRYVALKLLEYYGKHCGIDLRAPDIRPKGGWSPRETLATLFHEQHEIILSGDKPENHSVINTVCREAIKRLDTEYGLTVDHFQLQVFLCEYRESYEGRRQYPGRSHDSELGYGRKAAALWNNTSTDLWKARTALFPKAHLGELNGWNGPRKALGTVLSDHRYTWSDLQYNFSSTTDFSSPTRWKIPLRKTA